MRVMWVLPLVIGAVTVLQAGLNRQIASVWGLAWTCVLSAGVLLAVSAAWLGLTAMAPQVVPDIFEGSPKGFRWWYPVAGALGFVLIAGIPWAMTRLGALQVFVGIVFAQMVASMVWDAWVESIPVTPTRVAGAALALVGFALVSVTK